MDNEEHHKDVTKVLSMVKNVVIRNSSYKREFHKSNHPESEEREYGRLNADVNNLAETAEKYTKKYIVPSEKER
ncbi:hypothetical protein IP92_05774 [Pseudoduganella flava]|uniref:Uncharacterized protein n=1 Tax=Pseudoduganella flava TaxID=871742 RepID=A0A562P9Q5_9BURK|nr:hypothetical protein [Pseudoduganella flava]QGZ42696.1 hypothetical protein GO485_29125 [Pseudoduganella flava]TWI41053.1 hypothetical protein IP92_05774 [Pseudoduganella flava]